MRFKAFPRALATGLFASLSAAFLLAGQAAAVEGKLVLYTSQPNTDAQQTIDAFKAKHPKVEISFVRDGTPRVMAKLRAEFEAGAPQPDLLLIADAVTMEGLKKEDRLLAHDKADISAYPAGVHDKAKFWFATKLITTGIVYNTKAPLKPSSWLDLTKPEAKNLVAMPSPLNSGAAMIHTITLNSNLPTGWGFYEALQKNGALAAGANGDINGARCQRCNRVLALVGVVLALILRAGFIAIGAAAHGHAAAWNRDEVQCPRDHAAQRAHLHQGGVLSVLQLAVLAAVFGEGLGQLHGITGRSRQGPHRHGPRSRDRRARCR